MIGEGDESAASLFNLALRGGFYLWKGLEIEPEFWLTIPSAEYGAWEQATGYRMNLNLAYNVKTRSKLVPFILAGIGYGKGYPYFGIILNFEGMEGIWNLNGGVGFKWLVSSSAAFRVEYRFTHHWQKDYLGGTDWVNTHDFLVGISLFF